MHRSLKFVFAFLFCFHLATLQAESHHPQEFLRSIKGSKDEGMQIVNHFCISCHGVKPLIQLGAPKVNDENEWGPRVKQGIKVLLQHTEEGVNAMPARGGCFECSDEQLDLAILAMLPESLKHVILNKQKDHK
ncbi:Cytochrome c5 [Legionella massiliensis]|uniref:Cytochrome c5 n=1 Tax=Legionella massiliensis TaxID=1034943 RepID=A0A078L560_9GAMM|nr:c-type cytochrome [Legionella massiliensis]CDZ79048.1 Cytochrome c5 [Legionella massiliensis]CEE14786.1 Cytochrome c5 [Legionella massiliensis]